MLGAYVQAPGSIVGWVLKYQNSELYEVVRKISNGERLYSKLRETPVTWRALANAVFCNFTSGDEHQDEQLRRNFGRLWSRFASDFLDENSSYEYNSIKHGFRARMGGFFLAMGLQEQPAVPAPAEKMETMVNSLFGSSFCVPKRLHDRRNFTIRHQALNWDPINFVYGLQLISSSIHNILASLKILHGIPISQVPFEISLKDETFEEPWKRHPGISRFGMNSRIPEAAVRPLTKDEIISVYTPSQS